MLKNTLSAPGADLEAAAAALRDGLRAEHIAVAEFTGAVLRGVLTPQQFALTLVHGYPCPPDVLELAALLEADGAGGELPPPAALSDDATAADVLDCLKGLNGFKQLAELAGRQQASPAATAAADALARGLASSTIACVCSYVSSGTVCKCVRLGEGGGGGVCRRRCGAAAARRRPPAG